MPNKKIALEDQAELERLRREVKRFDDKGLHDTAHHEMLRALEERLGLKPAATPPGGVKEHDGKQDL